MPILADNSVLSYNGFTFPGGTSTRIKINPVLDESERTVIYNKISISAKCAISNNDASSQEAAMATIRNQLTAVGRDLRYRSHGMGEFFDINTAVVRDVVWGPKTKRLDFSPMGPIACILEWEVEVALPLCNNASYEKQIMAFNFSVEITIDRDGLSTRTISGYYEIPMTRRTGGRLLTDGVDSYWEKFVPAMVPGFTRETRQRTISYDKRRVDFTIVDVQQKGALPPNCTFADGSYSIANKPDDQTLFLARLSASYRVALGQSRQSALDAFYSLLRSRQLGKEKQVIFVAFSAEEGLYNDHNRVSFSAAWTYTSNINDCLKDGKMWTEIPKANWPAWASSEGVAKASASRGLADLRIRQTDDAIIDLCGGREKTASPGTTLSRERPVQPSTAIEFKKLNPEASWLAYYCDLIVEAVSNVVVLKPIPSQNPPDTLLVSSSSPSSSPPSFPSGGGTVTTNPVNNPQYPPLGRGTLTTNPADKDIIQRRAKPTYRAILVGYAVRALYPISPPFLLTVGGAKATPTKEQFGSKQIAFWGGYPIYRAEWRFEYILEEAPTRSQIVPPSNPAFNR